MQFPAGSDLKYTNTRTHAQKVVRHRKAKNMENNRLSRILVFLKNRLESTRRFQNKKNIPLHAQVGSTHITARNKYATTSSGLIDTMY